jgi:hypothetical protein
MDALDKALLRAHERFIEDGSDAVEAELGDLLPDLAKAGYVRESGHSPTGFFWAFTDAGIARGEELGFFDDLDTDD